MNGWTRVRALRSCSGDVHVARVVSLVVHAVVGLTLGLIHCSCCCRRFRHSVSVANFLYFEIFSLHLPSMTVNWVGCYRIDHCNLCTKLILRTIPRIIGPITVFTSFPDGSVLGPSSRWCLTWGMPPRILPLPPRWGRALPPILVISLILLIEATQSRQRFFEISSMPCGHRVWTNEIRTDPPIVAVHTNFLSSVVCVILVRQFIHLTNYFFSATQFNHGLSESCITDETIVNA